MKSRTNLEIGLLIINGCSNTKAGADPIKLFFLRFPIFAGKLERLYDVKKIVLTENLI